MPRTLRVHPAARHGPSLGARGLTVRVVMGGPGIGCAHRCIPFRLWAERGAGQVPVHEPRFVRSPSGVTPTHCGVAGILQGAARPRESIRPRLAGDTGR